LEKPDSFVSPEFFLISTTPVEMKRLQNGENKTQDGNSEKISKQRGTAEERKEDREGEN
jgi:hypothetical protein